MNTVKQGLHLLLWGSLIILCSPLLLVYVFIEAIQFAGRHGLMPIIYFAKYRDSLMRVVHQQEFDERAVKYQGSLEQLNEMDFQRQSRTPIKHPYDQRFEEIQEEKEMLTIAEAIFKKPPTNK